MFKRLIKSRILMAFILLTFVLLFGTTGFMVLEGYGLVDGLYMSAITVSTVGFGEVQPLSQIGRAFATALILLSFLALAFAGHTIGQSLLERVWSGQTERKKMKKRIQSLKNHYIVCGYGRVGASAASQLEKLASDFVVIEVNENQLSSLKEKGILYVNGDATNEDVLEEAGIKHARGLLALLNDDPENLFVVLTAREMNPTLNIISRSNETSSGHKIIRAGADDVVSPFDSAGKQIARDVLRVSGHNEFSVDLKNTEELSPKWITIEEGSSMIDQTIGELSHQMRQPIIGLRRNSMDHLMPEEKNILLSGDQILVFDECAEDACHTPLHSKPHRLVIVDDNPVILKLYSRLFQKAGFVPYTATNGQEGLDLIIKENPPAAVIDYQLPNISGIEVCRRVRKKMKRKDDIKLIVFTADNSEKTHQRALESGADAVVVKSSDAAEIIRTVNDILKI